MLMMFLLCKTVGDLGVVSATASGDCELRTSTTGFVVQIIITEQLCFFLYVEEVIAV